MLSVTQMTKRITQPYGGYLPIKSFQVHTYDDGVIVDVSSPEYSAFATIQGMVVDYLTRYMSGYPLRDAFLISLVGASMVSEEDAADALLNHIKGLDRNSIISACKLVSYDVAFRRGAEFYSPASSVEPPNTIISNIQVMVQRGLAFLALHAPVTCAGVTFEGGYTSLVSSGDADFLTADGLWDFKVSRNAHTTAETLQILMYYIMGIHSVHPEFNTIQKLGLFNPLKNESYEIALRDIPDTVFQTVSHDVLGFRVLDDPSQWKNTDGEDEAVKDAFVGSFVLENTDTDFDPNNYDDGIHDITVNDYWTYYRDKADWTILRPKFGRTAYIKFLKHDGFLMFVSVSPNGTLCILQGGFLRKLDKPIQYYYDRLPEYGNKVLELFSKYWDAIYDVSSYVCRVTGGQGYVRVHGCIVDIDFFNHIYINPFDGTVTPYYADSMCLKQTYQNLASLISAKVPHLLPAFQAEQALNPSALALSDGSVPHQALALTSQEVTEHSDVVYETEMNSVSNRLKALQLVYDHHLVAVWYDSILSPGAFLPPTDNEIEYEAKWDTYIDRHLNQYIKVETDERNSSPKEKRFLIWKTKARITQDELFALIRKLLRDSAVDFGNQKTISFGFGWCSKHEYQFVSVNCSPTDVTLFYKQLLKARQIYQNTVYLRLEITGTKKKTNVEVSVEFSGGSCPLAMKGTYKFENGRLALIEV